MLEISIDLDESGAAHGGDQVAELLGAVEDPVAIQIPELIAERRLPDRVLERRDVGAGVVVEAPEIRLPDTLATAAHVPRETKARADRVEVGDGRGRRRDRLEVRTLLGCEALLGPADLVAIEAQAAVDRETARDVPPVLHVNARRRRIVDALVRRVVDVDFARCQAAVAIVDVARLEAEKLAPLAVRLEAELEV